MLGDAGASYVVGYGTDPPAQPHHRTASCPGPTPPCGFSYFNTPDPNPNVIAGALVGGPNLDGSRGGHGGGDGQQEAPQEGGERCRFGLGVQVCCAPLLADHPLMLQLASRSIIGLTVSPPWSRSR